MSASRLAVSGAHSGGLATTVLPAARAGRDPPGGQHQRGVPRGDHRGHPGRGPGRPARGGRASPAPRASSSPQPVGEEPEVAARPAASRRAGASAAARRCRRSRPWARSRPALARCRRRSRAARVGAVRRRRRRDQPRGTRPAAAARTRRAAIHRPSPPARPAIAAESAARRWRDRSVKRAGRGRRRSAADPVPGVDGDPGHR